MLVFQKIFVVYPRLFRRLIRNFAEKEGRCILACRTNVRRHIGKRGVGRQAAGHFVDVPTHDVANEIKES